MPRDHIDKLNKQTMRDVVAAYAGNNRLSPPEEAALASLGDLAHKKILDIGIGGGRTVQALCDISRDYIGIDYVVEMVDECKRKFPDVRLEQGDARKLDFADNSFHVVMFSMNGISMVDHDGRIEILNEVFRVLSPGGAFLFSTYNSDFAEHKKFFRFAKFNLSWNPLKSGIRGLRYCYSLLIALRNRLRFRKMEVHTSEYSIVNDRCHNYATMLYYITHANQIKQLVSVGYDSEVVTFDALGNLITGSTLFDSIFYVTRKPH